MKTLLLLALACLPFFLTAQTPTPPPDTDWKARAEALFQNAQDWKAYAETLERENAALKQQLAVARHYAIQATTPAPSPAPRYTPPVKAPSRTTVITGSSGVYQAITPGQRAQTIIDAR